MDEYQIMALLMRLEIRGNDRERITDLFVETLAAASERMTDDEIRRFLICGAFLHHGGERNFGGMVADGSTESGRKLIDIPLDPMGPH